MGQRRLNSLGIIRVERAYGNQVIVNCMDKMINIFGQAMEPFLLIHFSLLIELSLQTIELFFR